MRVTNLAFETQYASGGAPLTKGRNLLAACLAHALHDGYTDGLYAFMPVWQAQFRLSYAGLAVNPRPLLRNYGRSADTRRQANARLSPRAALVLSTLVATAGLLIMALPLGLAGLCTGLVIAGVGSSIQHPRGSMLVSETYGTAARGPLGVYNFSGDLGKAALPAAAAFLLPVLAWRPVLGIMVALGLGTALGLLALAPGRSATTKDEAEKAVVARSGGGFGLLTLIGGLDTATRMGYLLFLPFLIQSRGGTSATVGLGLALLFIGGALGKATCSWLGQRLGVVGSVLVTEAATAGLITATMFMPLLPMLVALPLLGVVLNGTSSVLYGTVPELTKGKDTGRAFAVFYTSVIGSGGLAPIVYGAIADHSSRTVGVFAAALTAVAIVPLVLVLRPHLKSSAEAATGPANW